MRTWERAVGGRDVVVLDYGNVRDHLGDASGDLDAIRRLPLPCQKDAIMVAVLRRHGGVFMDADTLAVGDIGPVVARLDRSEVVMFGTHMAFVAARAHARLLDRWHAGIRVKLAALRRNRDAAVPWDYVGNSVLTATMDEIIATEAARPLPVAVADRAVALLAAAGRGALATRLRDAVLRRRKSFYFRTVYRKYLEMLERDAYGFVPESVHYGSAALGAQERYARFWLGAEAGLESVFLPRQTVIGLHHSWTPAWYHALSEPEVLAHPCLLSRALRHLLDGADDAGAGSTTRN
jgi:hypothetical protein